MNVPKRHGEKGIGYAGGARDGICRVARREIGRLERGAESARARTIPQLLPAAVGCSRARWHSVHWAEAQ
jgi:hypothetical protein